MKKVGILTFQWVENNNYGAILQAYALNKIIIGMGFESEVIDYLPSFAWNNTNSIDKISKNNQELCLASIVIGLKRSINSIIKAYLNKLLLESKYNQRQHRFEKFHDRYIKLSQQKYYGYILLYQNPPIYDCYIVGSDQVWNPYYNYNDPSYFLTFIPDINKCISYAASFGVSSIPIEYKGIYAERLNHLNVISVRESQGVSIVEELTGRDATLVLDPTLLLSYHDWEKIASPCKITEPYILCYFLSPIQYIKKLAYHIKKLTGFRIIQIGGGLRDRLDPYKRTIYDAGPLEFLGLFQRASFIVTDSFHGMAFAINFEKPFFTVLRSVENEKSINSRQTNMLELFNLKSRLLPIDAPLPFSDQLEIDYTEVTKILERKKIESVGYLQNAIGLLNCNSSGRCN